jgi:cytochrome c oxidase subunit 4
MYLAVFGALLLLTAVTVSVGYVDLGIFNTFIAMSIAVVKASLVVLFFMHLRYTHRLDATFLGAGVLWLLILLALTLSDYLSRGWLGASAG